MNASWLIKASLNREQNSAEKCVNEVYTVYHIDTPKNDMRSVVNGLDTHPPPIPIYLLVLYLLYDWQMSCFFNFIEVCDFTFTYHFRAGLLLSFFNRLLYEFPKKIKAIQKTAIMLRKMKFKTKHYLCSIYYIMYLYQAKQWRKMMALLCKLINALPPTNLHFVLHFK